MKISVLITLFLGWGRVGHEVIGDITTAFHTAKAKQQIEKAFGKYPLRLLSNWADIARRDPKFADWTPVLHYVNVNYNRKQNPEFDDWLDCPQSQCVVGAIAKYTKEADCRLPVTEEWMESFLFLIHFIGETTQPLHTCGRERGGADTRIIIDGKPNNLHYVWDTVIIQKRIQTAFNRQREGYVTYLVNSITTGQYKNVANTWLSTQGTTATSQLGNSMVAIDYVKDTVGAGGSNCKAIWLPYDQYPSQDFGKDYSTNNMHVVDLQLAKAGYRLAHFLNQMYSKCPNP